MVRENKRKLGSLYDADFISLLYKLRYGSNIYSDKLKPILNYVSIAKLLSINASTVRLHCLYAVDLMKKGF